MGEPRSVLVTGATGKQGGSVTRALLKRGHRVRALTRNVASVSALSLAAQGVEVATGDFADAESLVRAARGVDTVFAMGTPFEVGAAKEQADGIALANAVKKAGVGHLIYSSVGGAHQNTGIPHFDSKYAVEEHIREIGVQFTIIGPVFFMENLVSAWNLPGLRAGTVAMPMPAGRKLQQLSFEDIGSLVALLVERRKAVFGRRFDVAGDELSGEATAAVLAAASGRPIRYTALPVEAIREQNPDVYRLFKWFDEVGYSADIAGLRREFPEVGWHRLKDWARKQDWAKLLAPETAPA